MLLPIALIITINVTLLIGIDIILPYLGSLVLHITPAHRTLIHLNTFVLDLTAINIFYIRCTSNMGHLTVTSVEVVPLKVTTVIYINISFVDMNSTSPVVMYSRSIAARAIEPWTIPWSTMPTTTCVETKMEGAGIPT